MSHRSPENEATLGKVPVLGKSLLQEVSELSSKINHEAATGA